MIVYSYEDKPNLHQRETSYIKPKKKKDSEETLIPNEKETDLKIVSGTQ
jgi:hypothetical protein